MEGIPTNLTKSLGGNQVTCVEVFLQRAELDTTVVLGQRLPAYQGMRWDNT